MILSQGRWCRGWPLTTASLRMISRSEASLCLKVRMLAPEARAPLTIEVWLRVSLISSEPGPASAGIVEVFVLYP